MRRRVVSTVKFLIMAAGVVASTVLIFKLVRPYTRHHSIQMPEALFQQGFNPEKLPIEPQDSKEIVLIDWHDYGKIQRDLRKVGIGEHGKPASLKPEDDEIKEKLYSVNGFNGALSDKISLHRSLPDIRHSGCKTMKYNAYLPTVSVVVPFHNEHWTTLLRTAHSVIDRSPEHLLKEIILVDDFSNKPFLRDPLDEYVKANFTNVKVIHLPERKGLIVARLTGAKAATGDVLIFLDSHVEANVNWLPPLLHPISLDYRTCVCPFIDVVAYETFEYRAQDEGARGAFDWEFFYKRLPVLPEDEAKMPEPFASPVMAGGLFAISSKFFWELGGYDEELQIWGGEQYELSFKIWQCGGKMLDAPCSRVGHIYRKFAPFPNAGKGDFVGRNYRRVAEVWMDGYKEFLYNRRPHYRDIDPGDLTKQRAIREKLQCKPFKWFMKEVAFDLPKKYPPLEPEPFASGTVKSAADESLCVDTKNFPSEKRFGVSKCNEGTENHFIISWHKDIRIKGRSMCWDVSQGQDKAPVVLFGCHLQGGNQFWRYDPNKKWLIHGGNPRCLDVDVATQEIYLRKCDANANTQRWIIEHVNLDRLEKFNEEPSLDYDV